MMAPVMAVFIVFAILIFLYFVPLGLWFQSGVSIGFGIVLVKRVILFKEN